jgi:cysteine-rich repeat protein
MCFLDDKNVFKELLFRFYMNKKINLFFLGIILIISLGIISASDSCPTNPPITYKGIISYEENVLVGNYYIKAMIGDKIVSLEEEILEGRYSLDVNPCYGVTSGEIKFFINGLEANEKISYDAENWGKEINFNLTLNELPNEGNICGNGIIDFGEECDDGNNQSEDGCSYICAVEYGYKCTGQPSICTISPNNYCGDGICNNGETCSTCSQDCGTCQTTNTPTSSGGSSGGGGGGGGSPSSDDQDNNQTDELVLTSYNKSNLDDENNNQTSEIGNKEFSGISGITGAVVGFGKSKWGIGAISIIGLLIIGLIVVKIFKKNGNK